MAPLNTQLLFHCMLMVILNVAKNRIEIFFLHLQHTEVSIINGTMVFFSSEWGFVEVVVV